MRLHVLLSTVLAIFTPGCETDPLGTTDASASTTDASTTDSTGETEETSTGGTTDGPLEVGGPCDGTCDCAGWGGWSGLRYLVCATDCTVDADCPSPTSCQEGRCLEACAPSEDTCSVAGAVCVTPTGGASWCAFPP